MANGMMRYDGGRVLTRVPSAPAEPPPIVEFASAPACAAPVQINAAGGVVAIPAAVARWICWTYKGIARSPRAGRATSVALTSNEVVLPVGGKFEVGPDLAPLASLGKFFPYEWETEAIGRGIFRFKVDFIVRIIAGGLTVDQVVNAANNLEFRIIQIGTEDRWDVALNIGDAQDAAKSALEPAAGGYWLPDGEEFVPYNPTTFAFDFSGLLIGGPGDQYGIRANIRSYFRDVQC